VTPRDSHDSDLGGGCQKAKRRRVTRDTTTGRGDKDLSPRDRDDKPTRQPNESSYAAAPASAVQRPSDAEPLKVKIEFVVVDGRAAEELIRTQASALKEALQWFADNRPGGGNDWTAEAHRGVCLSTTPQARRRFAMSGTTT
jgi:hypothetical protein